MLLPSPPRDPGRDINNRAVGGRLADGPVRGKGRHSRTNPILSGPAFFVEMPNVSGELDDLDRLTVFRLKKDIKCA